MERKSAVWTLLALLVLPGLAHAFTITIFPSTLGPATVGQSYTEKFTATGGTAPYQFSVDGALPDGLDLTGDGTLSGIPTAGGHFNFKIMVTDDAGETSEQNYHLDVNPADITVLPPSLSSATYGKTYSETLTASGGTAPYSFAASGSLPDGLTLSSTGELSGTPTESGDFSFTVTATDSSTGDGPYSGSTDYVLHVTGPTLTLSPPSGTLTADYGQPYSQTFTASGGGGPYTYDLTGSLPNGLNWSATSHTISGTPTQSGSFPFTVTATDSDSGATVTQGYIL
ncbi:MAG TPA: putative Ig domain-containing protein, partial [Gammaproteobacteria bacterium]|nr:putative Ig domain-containing protein [Gammaproteobacteria bacterium]